MSKRPDDDDLVNLFVLQFDLHLPKTHEFYVEWLMWFNRLALDPVRNYEGLWKLSHDWIRRKKETKNRREALKDTLPGVAAGQNNSKGCKGTGKDKNGDPQVCSAWRNTGVCARKDAGTCIYAHPMNMKNIGKPAGDKEKVKTAKGQAPLNHGAAKVAKARVSLVRHAVEKQLPIQN